MRSSPFFEFFSSYFASFFHLFLANMLTLALVGSRRHPLACVGSHWLVLAHVGSRLLTLARVGSRWLALTCVGSRFLTLAHVSSHKLMNLISLSYSMPAFSANSFWPFYEGHRNNLDFKQPKSFIYLKIVQSGKWTQAKLKSYNNKALEIVETKLCTSMSYIVHTWPWNQNLAFAKKFSVGLLFCCLCTKNSFCFATFFILLGFLKSRLFQWPS